MIDLLSRPKPRRDGRRDGTCRAGVRMTVPHQTPIRIEVYQHHRNVVTKNPFSEATLNGVLRSEFRNDHERYGVATARHFDDREEHLARHVDAAFDCRVATIRNQQTGERHEPRFVLLTFPTESRSEMWPIVVEVAPEELGHED